jgi:UDP-2,3-diacylglucosamine hydrolase
MIHINLTSGKKVYFASDFHLGFPDEKTSREREKALVSWLDQVQSDAQDLFLLGDLFDFWFEYKTAVPRGFVRFLGKLSALADQGINLHIFVGNHDLWMWDYLEREIGAKIYREPSDLTITSANASFQLHIGHGDGLGPGDTGYKILKKVFTNRLAQWLFGFLHPNVGISLANFWSSTRKESTMTKGEQAFDPHTDYILSYVRETAASKPSVMAFVFGHRHHPIAYPLPDGATYYNLGDWFNPQFKNAYFLQIDEHKIDFIHFNASSSV